MALENPDSVFTKNDLKNISKEFTRLKDKTYLDHAGATLCPESVLKTFMKDQVENLYLNPHTSKYTTDCIDQIRYMILNNLNTNADEYSVIFTSGSTAALKLVAESFDYDSGGAFVYLEDNHTSVLGMRELTSSSGADIVNVSRTELIDCMDKYNESDEEGFHDTFNSINQALFVYPAQSNFNGFKYPLSWIERIHSNALNEFTHEKIGKKYSDWIVLLDTAAYLSTNNLDLSMYKPDFCCISFYKIFGYPTGLGALIVKNSISHWLKKKYYGGGTVEIAMSRVNYHVKRECLHERFEDGTVSFLSILALKYCFDTLNRIIPSKINGNFMDTISRYTFYLAQILYQRLKLLYHSNGKPVIKLYADSEYDNINQQGGILNFNILRSDGQYYGYAEVVHMSELFNIFVRSGCFCNPGACQRHLQLSNEDLLKHFKAGHKCGDDNDLVDGVPTGSIRVSFGYMSTKEDIDTFMSMINKCFVEGEPIFVDNNVQSLSKKIKNFLVLNKTPKKHQNQIIPKNLKIEINPEIKKAKFKGKLKEIFLYPIKSCAPFKVTTWKIGSRGLEYDRDWMIITETGVALTQKQETKMCLIQPSLDLERGILTLSFSGVDDISISIDNKNDPYFQPDICHSKVCGDKIQGYDCGNEVSVWLSDVLMLPGLRLIRQTVDDYRISKKSNATDSSISLSNQAQYLMINLSSVKWLAKKVVTGEFDDRLENLTARFRGNLIVESETEFDEFSWEWVTIGSNVFHVDGPCTRCQMVCIDQETGDKTTEPLHTISKELKGKLHFGAYITFSKSSETDNILSTGDNINATLKC